jgi:hypothetical protein
VVLDRGIICYHHPSDSRVIGVDPAVAEDIDGQPSRYVTHVAEFGRDTLAWFVMLLLNRLRSQAEALILGRANRMRASRPKDMVRDPSYTAAVDAQLTIPDLYSYFRGAISQRVIQQRLAELGPAWRAAARPKKRPASVRRKV